jgi:Na+-driven multidrug efflux pump
VKGLFLIIIFAVVVVGFVFVGWSDPTVSIAGTTDQDAEATRIMSSAGNAVASGTVAVTTTAVINGQFTGRGRTSQLKGV